MIGASHQWTAAVGQERGHGRLLDLGAEEESHSCSRTISSPYPKDYCSVLHQSASRSRPNTLRSTSPSVQKVSVSAALQLLDIAPILPVRLADHPGHVPGFSGLKQQELHDHVPGSLLLHTTGLIAHLHLWTPRPSICSEAFKLQGLSRLSCSTVSRCGPSTLLVPTRYYRIYCYYPSPYP